MREEEKERKSGTRTAGLTDEEIGEEGRWQAEQQHEYVCKRQVDQEVVGHGPHSRRSQDNGHDTAVADDAHGEDDGVRDAVDGGDGGRVSHHKLGGPRVSLVEGVLILPTGVHAARAVQELDFTDFPIDVLLIMDEIDCWHVAVHDSRSEGCVHHAAAGGIIKFAQIQLSLFLALRLRDKSCER